jgi:hypothetical protein
MLTPLVPGHMPYAVLRERSEKGIRLDADSRVPLGTSVNKVVKS